MNKLTSMALVSAFCDLFGHISVLSHENLEKIKHDLENQGHLRIEENGCIATVPNKKFLKVANAAYVALLPQRNFPAPRHIVTETPFGFVEEREGETQRYPSSNEQSTPLFPAIYETEVETLCDSQALILKTTVIKTFYLTEGGTEDRYDQYQMVLLQNGQGVLPRKSEIHQWILGADEQDIVRAMNNVFGPHFQDNSDVILFLETLSRDPIRDVEQAVLKLVQHLPY